MANPTIALTAHIKQKKRMAFAPTNEEEVERHSSRVTDDFGFNNLLPDGDEVFWGYVSDAQAELATNPLTFPIPSTIESASTSYTGLHTTHAHLTASTARPLTQHAKKERFG